MSRKPARGGNRSKLVQGKAARWGTGATAAAHWLVSKIKCASKHAVQGRTVQIKSRQGYHLSAKITAMKAF